MTSDIHHFLNLYLQQKNFCSTELINKLDISIKHKLILTELSNIPYGTTISYADFAKQCNLPKEIRNIATLIGKNPLPIIIPCHRVILKSGEIGQYIFGSELKRRLIEFEEGLIDELDLSVVIGFYGLKNKYRLNSLSD